MAIEEEFDVVIDENAIEMIETVEQAYQAIGQSEDTKASASPRFTRFNPTTMEEFFFFCANIYNRHSWI